jgi:hypothetical protein
MNAENASFGMPYIIPLKKTSLEKLERFLVSATDLARAEGYTIVSRVFHPEEYSCCPIHAACKDHRSENYLPSEGRYSPRLYEEIISEVIGETFDITHLRAFMNGFDTDKPFMHYTFFGHPHRDEAVFKLGRKLREKYIPAPKLLPAYVPVPLENACMSEDQLSHYVKTKELPNVMFGHINFCRTCKSRLEEACGCISRMDAISFFQSNEIRGMALRHVNSCSSCYDLLNQVSEASIPIERAMVLYRPEPTILEQPKKPKKFSLFQTIANGMQGIKNWINRWAWV